MFPAPREVERYLYLDEPEKVKIPQFVFPPPREVDRYLYSNFATRKTIKQWHKFPAPREVDREIYKKEFLKNRWNN